MQTYTVIVYEAEPDEGGYWAKVLELPGCYASGDTLDELELDVREAIEAFVEHLKDKGEPVPTGKQDLEPGSRRWEIAVA